MSLLVALALDCVSSERRASGERFSTKLHLKLVFVFVFVFGCVESCSKIRMSVTIYTYERAH